MPATLTWGIRGPYTFTIAGANPTVAEVLAALNTLITANCTMWAVSQYNAGNGTLELKRNSFPGAPTGELATVRFLIFGGSSPNAAALPTGASAGATTNLYCGLSVDANTTGPSASYTAGAPYATKYTKAPLITAPASAFTTANTVKITLYEADDVFGFSIGDSANMASCFMGRCIVATDGSTLVWAVLPSGTATGFAINTAPNSISIGVGHPVTWFGQTAGAAKGVCWDTAGGGTALQVGRIMGFQWSATVDTGLGASGGAGMLIPVPVVAGAQAATPVPTFYGTMRQIRFGPVAAHLNKLRDSSAVLQGTHVLSGTGVGMGLWLDELP
jgi:hypothetical protein